MSSARTISEADLATAVPEPMAIPISAFFRAGASFTPSPVWIEKVASGDMYYNKRNSQAANQTIQQSYWA